MKALRSLVLCKLNKKDRVKQKNGTYLENYVLIDEYKVTLQELTDVVSASIYGASINKTYRISSIYNKLEKLLSSKLTNQEDNISKYNIEIDHKNYKIVSVKKKYLDIELI